MCVHSRYADTPKLGDGKLGNLIAQALHADFPEVEIVVFGRYQKKLDLIPFKATKLTCTDYTPYLARFGVVIEATGSSQGGALAVSLTKSTGLVLLKSTCGGEQERNGEQMLLE